MSKGGGIIKEVKKIVYTLEECKKLETEGYKLEAITYWEGTPKTTAYHMIKHTT